MKSGIIAVIFCGMITLNITAQNPGQIIIGKENKKTTYQQNGKYLTQEELAEVLKSYPATAREYQVSSSLENIGMAFAIPGVLMTGVGGIFGVSKVLGIMGEIAYFNDNPEKSNRYHKYADITAISGLGMMIVGCTFHFMSISVQKRSVSIYNGINPAGRIENIKIYFSFTGNGAGVRLKF